MKEHFFGYTFECCDCGKEYDVCNSTTQEDYYCPYCKSKNVEMIVPFD